MEFLSPKELIVTALFWRRQQEQTVSALGTINGAHSPVWKYVILNGFSRFQRSKEAKNSVGSLTACLIYLGACYSSHCLFFSACWCEGHPCTLEL